MRLSGTNTTANVVAGKYIGTNAAGTAPVASLFMGVIIDTAAFGNRIGTNGDGVGDVAVTGGLLEGNLISGNVGQGVTILAANSNVVAGNYIGTNVAGTAALANLFSGVWVHSGSKFNRIGTDGSPDAFNASERNLISGNNGPAGIWITHAGTENNTIAGNYIGTDVSDTLAVGNVSDGVQIEAEVKQTTIGGTSAVSRNIISGNNGHGIVIAGSGATGNVVAGNFVGLDAAGTAALGNGLNGVSVWLGAAGDTIGGSTSGARNIISGNARSGVTITDAGTQNNLVAGNYVGTDVNGTQDLGNGHRGLFIAGGASANVIGVNSDGSGDALEGNVISGNGLQGVFILGAGTDSNVIAGNLIGTTATGSAALGNSNNGILIDSGPRFNRIGTNGDGVSDSLERNVISASGQNDIVIAGSGADQNTVAGNFIGTNAAGAAALANSMHGVRIESGARFNVIGTNGDGEADALEGNLLSGNINDGVRIVGSGADGNVVAGNLIGTNASGTAAIHNGWSVSIAGGAQANRIGTNGDGISDAAERNVISGNWGGGAVWLEGAGTNFNVVAGNYIGTDISGTSIIANQNDGVRILSGAQSNRIGTNGDGIADAAERNIIAGSALNGVRITDPGTQFNTVAGNYIGTDVTGTLDRGNTLDGVRIDTGAANNTIGGTSAAQRNVISGNNLYGIALLDVGTTANIVGGNYIGTSSSGTANLGNTKSGVFITAHDNTIGGIAAGAGNLISGNDETGVAIVGGSASGNMVLGNFIGVNAVAMAPLGNGHNGVVIEDAPGNTIGGATA